MKKIMLAMLAAVLLVVASTSLTSFVKAEQYGCCVITNDGHYCVDNAAESSCQSGWFFIGACADVYPECKPVTCITEQGNCMDNVPKLVCEHEYDGSVDYTDKCEKGCCIVGSYCDYVEFAKCEYWARNLTIDVSEIGFYPEITNQHDCLLKCSASDRGTCIKSDGQCVYTTRGNCDGEFVANTYPYQIPHCNVEHCVRLGCGIMPGDENKICCFDSAGNQEECPVACEEGISICTACDGENCNANCRGERRVTVGGSTDESDCSFGDTNNNEKLDTFEPYCKKTQCSLEGVFNQELTGINVTRDKVIVSITAYFHGNEWISLDDGHAVCSNMIYANVTKEDSVFVEFDCKDVNGNPCPKNNNDFAEAYKNYTAYLAGRTTGLQAYKVVCHNGELIWTGLSSDRKQLCLNDEENIATYLVENNYEECEKCGVDTGAGGRWRDPLGDLLGRGLLGAWLGQLVSNQCKPADCRNITVRAGNKTIAVCDYARKFQWRGSATIGRCVPRFAPGTSDLCETCGAGGDWISNTCHAGECYALGNCEFTENNPGMKLWIFTIHSLGTFISSLYTTSWIRCIPIASLVECEGKGLSGSGVACFIVKYPICTFIKEPIEVSKPLFDVLSVGHKTVKGALKDIWDALSTIDFIKGIMKKASS